MPLISTDDLKAVMGFTSDADDLLARYVVPRACRAVENYVGFPIELGTRTDLLRASPPIRTRDPLVDRLDIVGGRVVQREDFAGSALRILQLPSIPVRRVVSVHEDLAANDSRPPDWSSASELFEGSDFYVDWARPQSASDQDDGFCLTGSLHRHSGLWSRWPRSIKVVYRSGFTLAELDLRTGRYNCFADAALTTAQKMYREAKEQAGQGGILTAETIDGWSQTFAVPTQTQTGLTRVLPMGAMKAVEEWVSMTKYL